MPTNFANDVEAFYDDYVTCDSDIDLSETYRSWAIDANSDNNYKLAITWLINCCYKQNVALYRMLTGSYPGAATPFLPQILRQCWEYDYEDPPVGEEYELTYTKICEAWAKDDFMARGLTIAFIDRMRQLLWNESFSVKWAARPEI